MSFIPSDKEPQPGNLYSSAAGQLLLFIGQANLTGIKCEFHGDTDRPNSYEQATICRPLYIVLPDGGGRTWLQMIKAARVEDIRVAPMVSVEVALGSVALPKDPFTAVRRLAVRSLETASDPSIHQIAWVSGLCNAVAADAAARICGEFAPYLQRVQAAVQEHGGVL